MTQEASISANSMKIEDDRPLWDVVLGIYGYPALLLAHKLKVFPLLANEALTLPAICDKLNIKRRPAEAILTTATALGFLSLQDERYSLTPVAEHYLLETSPNYFGFFWDLMIDDDQVHSFASLKRAVLTDTPQVYGGSAIYGSHEDQAEQVRRFTRGMYSFSITSAFCWPGVLDLSSHRIMLDIGGSSGAHSIGAVSKLPHLQAIVFDFPLVCQVAKEFIARHNLQSRIKTCEGDMWSDPLPSADLHFYSSVYNDWPPDKCNFLTAKSFNSLPSGGRIIIHGMLYNDEKTGPFATAAFSMLMMGWTEGESYSAQELSTMLSEAGFQDIQVYPAFGYYSVVTGLKP
ncbi:methyltransferase [Nitrosovibrio sp. Nv4]|uniref:methyltransferase n=1 Tax=Nitrosovibrio sp. Nv4 TaxID=1945880 RepID=UPI000BC3AD67|nr:methyltransferase [Nitrosovibrio sp. Nv4]SOD41420.1 Dimerisation domain-containing protein [Nitrosovibrio sp. Nv4]